MTDVRNAAEQEQDPALETGPLSDIVVVDLTRALSGPHAAMMLGDLGARVIKVEPPTGDDVRGWGPPFVRAPDDLEGDPVSTYFLAANRNKESVIADLKTEDGRVLLAQLVRRADVLLENYRPGVLDRLGMSHEHLHTLNPRLVIGSITGFGHDGPEATRAGYDQIAQGEGGIMSVTGEPGHPTRVGLPIADLLAGMNLAYGVAAALHERHRTGRGRIVRTSLLASVIGVHAFQGTRWTVAGEVPTAQGNHHPSIAPYGLFAAADGPVQISVGSQGQWASLSRVLGLDADADEWATNADRVRNRSGLVAAIEAVLASATSDAWIASLTEAGIPAGRVRRIDEVYAWDQTASQGLLIDVEHPRLGRITLPGSALRFDQRTDSGARSHHVAPPDLGADTDAVRAWLGGS